jgi:tetratricopeptide (TPR) repeat protein
MKKLRSFQIILISLFFVNLLHGQQVIDLIESKKPFYTWASQIEISQFNPMGEYEEILDSAPLALFHLRFNPRLLDYFLIGLEAGYGTARLTNNQDAAYQIIPVGVNFNYQIPLGREFSLSTRAGGGEYFFILPDGQYYNLYAKAGAGLSYRLTSNLESSVHGDFIYFRDEKKSIPGWKASFGLTYIFGTVLSEKDIKITSVSMEKIFAPLYPVYYNKPIGVLKIKNTTGSTLKNIRVSLYVEKYMDHKSVSRTEKNFLPKEGEALIPLYTFFNERIKSLKGDTSTTGVLEIEYVKANGEKFIKKDTVALKIYGRNALIWDDLHKLGSFISSRNEALIDFTRKALSAREKDPETSFLPKDIQNAVRVFQSLKLADIRYVKDPKTPYESFSGQGFAVDYIQYPDETLNRKTGDCDDLSVLTASLLESMGITTAFVTVPGHIFILMEADSLPPSDKLVVYRGKKWIPLETTVLSKGFFEAWMRGYENFHQNPVEEILLTQEAVQKFSPILTGDSKPLAFNVESGQLLKDSREEIIRIQSLFSKPAPSENEIAALSAKELNSRGVSFCRTGEFQKGEKLYLLAVQKDENYKSPYYNLFLLYRIRKEYQKGIALYEKFKTQFPKDGQAALLMSQLYHEMKEDGKAQELYKLAIRWEPKLMDQRYQTVLRDTSRTRANPLGLTVKWYQQ